MIKLLDNFESLNKRLGDACQEGILEDYRIILRSNRDIEAFALANGKRDELPSLESSFAEYPNAYLNIVTQDEIDTDSFYQHLFNQSGKANLSFSRPRLNHLLDAPENTRTTRRNNAPATAALPLDEAENPNPLPCPVVAFYSYKGGMGRSTFLAATAAHLAYHEDHRVVIIDCDFEAPGFENFFLEYPQAPKHHDGFVEYVFNQELNPEEDISRYLWQASKAFSGKGELWIMPAGNLDDERREGSGRRPIDDYLEGLSRLDFSSREYIRRVFENVLRKIHEEKEPTLIFIDSRTGFNDVFGLVASRFANLMVGFFGITVQHQAGMRQFIEMIARRQRNFTGMLVNSFSNPGDAELFRQMVDRLANELDAPSEDPSQSPGPMNLETFHFGRNETLASLGTPYETVEYFQKTIAYKGLIHNYIEIFERIGNLAGQLAPAKEQKEELDTQSKQEKQPQKAPKNNERLELQKSILEKLAEQMPNLYAENIDILAEFKNKRHFFRPCMMDLFNESKFLVLGSKGTGKSYIFQSLKHEKIVDSLKKKSNRVYTKIFFQPIVDKKESKLLRTEKLPLIADGQANAFYRNFWLVFTWAQIDWASLKQRIGFVPAEKPEPIYDEETSANWLAHKAQDGQAMQSIEAEMRRLDAALRTKNQDLMLIFDNLDEMVIPPKWATQIAPLLNFWKHTSYTNIFSKLFIRRDLFNKVSGITNIQDMANNAIDLEWSKEEIFAFFFKLVFSHSKENFFKLMESFGDHDESVIASLRKTSKDENQLPLEDSFLRKLSLTFFGKEAQAARYGEPYDWFYRNLMNSDGTISLRPFLDMIEAAIKKWKSEVVEGRLKLREKPILHHHFYMDSKVRTDAVERHFNDLASEEGNGDLRRVFAFIDKTPKFQRFEFKEGQFDEMLNAAQEYYQKQNNPFESVSNDALKELLKVNGIIKITNYGGRRMFSFAFLYKYKLGLKGGR